MIIVITRPKKNQTVHLDQETEIQVQGMDDATDAEILRAAADQLDPPE